MRRHFILAATHLCFKLTEWEIRRIVTVRRCRCKRGGGRNSGRDIKIQNQILLNYRWKQYFLSLIFWPGICFATRMGFSSLKGLMLKKLTYFSSSCSMQHFSKLLHVLISKIWGFFKLNLITYPFVHVLPPPAASPLLRRPSRSSPPSFPGSSAPSLKLSLQKCRLYLAMPHRIRIRNSQFHRSKWPFFLPFSLALKITDSVLDMRASSFAVSRHTLILISSTNWRSCRRVRVISAWVFARSLQQRGRDSSARRPRR